MTIPLANQWGTFRYNAAELAKPTNVEEVVALVRRAAERGLRVKPFGGGHSFNAIIGTGGIAVDLSAMRNVLAIDLDNATMEVEGGMTICDIIEAGDLAGLHFPSLGSWHSQSIAGAIATSTHGSSMTWGSLSDLVLAVEAVLADGSVVRYESGEELRAFRCNLGHLGIVTKVKLQLTPAFWLHCSHETLPDEQGFAEIAERSKAAEYVNMLWLPYLETAAIRTLNRTDVRKRNQASIDLEEAFTGKTRFGHTVEDLRNYLLGHTVLRAPKLLMKLYSGAVRKAFDEDDGVIDKSYRVFLYDQYREPTENRVLRMIFNSEYAIDLDRVAEVMARMKRLIQERFQDGDAINYPRIHVRFAPKSDATLIGLNTDRDTAYIGLYFVSSIRHAPQIPIAEALEQIMADAGGRPHWGKYRYLSGNDYEPSYFGLAAFNAIRGRLDPGGMFGDGAAMFDGLPRMEQPPPGRLCSIFRKDVYRPIRLL